MYKIFELASHISNPIALSAFIATVFFFVLMQVLKHKKSNGQTLTLVVNRLFVIATIALAFGFSGWVWVNTGATSLEGIVYVHTSISKERDILSGVDVKVLSIRKPGRTDEYGRFSIPVNKDELRKVYTIQLVSGNLRKIYDLNTDSVNVNNIILNLYDTSANKSLSSQTDLKIKFAALNQTVPLIENNPLYLDQKVFCEALQLDLLLNHNEQSDIPIHVREIKLESNQIKLNDDNFKKLDYHVNADNIKGYGVTKIDEYLFTIGKGKLSGTFIADHQRVLKANPDNLFEVNGQLTAFDLLPKSDSYLQKRINIQLRTPGLYQLRFKVTYDITDSTAVTITPWVYITHN